MDICGEHGYLEVCEKYHCTRAGLDAMQKREIRVKVIT